MFLDGLDLYNALPIETSFKRIESRIASEVVAIVCFVILLLTNNLNVIPLKHNYFNLMFSEEAVQKSAMSVFSALEWVYPFEISLLIF